MGNVLYTTDIGTNTVGEYNVTTGATINASFITGLDGPRGLSISGNNLYVSNSYDNTVGVYDATTGAAVNASLISSGLNSPYEVLAIVPEPGTWALVVVGVAAVVVTARRGHVSRA